eukprot:gene25523-55407_t
MVYPAPGLRWTDVANAYPAAGLRWTDVANAYPAPGLRWADVANHVLSCAEPSAGCAGSPSPSADPARGVGRSGALWRAHGVACACHAAVLLPFGAALWCCERRSTPARVRRRWAALGGAAALFGVRGSAASALPGTGTRRLVARDKAMYDACWGQVTAAHAEQLGELRDAVRAAAQGGGMRKGLPHLTAVPPVVAPFTPVGAAGVGGLRDSAQTKGSAQSGGPCGGRVHGRSHGRPLGRSFGRDSVASWIARDRVALRADDVEDEPLQRSTWQKRAQRP